MPILCERHRLLFIMTPITACSAVGRALVDQLDGRHLPAEDVLDGDGKVIVDQKHATYPELLRHGVLDEGTGRSLFKFATVRNPFDRLVSIYAKRRNKLVKHLDRPHSWIHRFPNTVEDIRFCRDHTFDEWIEAHYSRSLVDRLRGKGQSRMMLKWLKGVDFVMRYERLDDDLAEALRRAGVEQKVEVPVFHRTRGRDRDFRGWYSDKSRRIVEGTFRDLLDELGYSFDSGAPARA